MKKNKIILLIFNLVISSLVSCGETKIKFEVSVSDVNGKPLSNVECLASMYRGKNEGGPGLAPYNVSAITASDGRALLQGETVYFNNTIVARKTGYYESRFDRMWITGREGNRWEPWPVEVKLVMKKIVDPKPMYAAKFDGQKWLAFPNKQLGPFGFDLMVGDWVEPHGAGRVADFIIQASRDEEDESEMNPKGKIMLTFSNPDDGILKMTDQGGSILIGPGIAPEGGYEASWDFANWQPHATEENLISQDFSDEVYVFRVRTKMDDEGNMVRSHYGKIHGRIVGWLPKAVPSVLMTYYLNGSNNDLGLEWNQNSNLIEDTSRMRTPQRP